MLDCSTFSPQCPTEKRSHLFSSGFCQFWTDLDSSLVAYRSFNKGGDVWSHTLGWQWSPPKKFQISQWQNQWKPLNCVCDNTGCIFLNEPGNYRVMCKNGLSFIVIHIFFTLSYATYLNFGIDVLLLWSTCCAGEKKTTCFTRLCHLCSPVRPLVELVELHKAFLPVCHSTWASILWFLISCDTFTYCTCILWFIATNDLVVSAVISSNKHNNTVWGN